MSDSDAGSPAADHHDATLDAPAGDTDSPQVRDTVEEDDDGLDDDLFGDNEELDDGLDDEPT